MLESETRHAGDSREPKQLKTALCDKPTNQKRTPNQRRTRRLPVIHGLQQHSTSFDLLGEQSYLFFTPQYLYFFSVQTTQLSGSSCRSIRSSCLISRPSTLSLSTVAPAVLHHSRKKNQIVATASHDFSLVAEYPHTQREGKRSRFGSTLTNDEIPLWLKPLWR